MQKAVRGSLGADVDVLVETCEYRARTKQRQGVDGLTGRRLGGVGPQCQLSKPSATGMLFSVQERAHRSSGCWLAEPKDLRSQLTS